MSVSAIPNASTSSLIDSVNQNMQSKLRQFQQEFQQLGTDLQAGNLSAAQQDFSTLPGSATQSSSTSSTASSNPIVQAFNQLAQDLQSGNISAAQQDYGTLKQDFQNGRPGAQQSSPPRARFRRRQPAGEPLGTGTANGRRPSRTDGL